MASSLIKSVASSFINAISEKGVMKAREATESGFLLLLGLLLMMKVVGKRVTRAVKGYYNMVHMDKNFWLPSILQAISRILSISITNLGLMVFLKRWLA